MADSAELAANLGPDAGRNATLVRINEGKKVGQKQQVRPILLLLEGERKLVPFL